MIETVNVIKKSYEKAPSYCKEKNNWKVGWSDEIIARIQMSKPYVVCNGIQTITDEMARAASVDVRRSSTVKFAQELTEIFKVSTKKEFWHLCAR